MLSSIPGIQCHSRHGEFGSAAVGCVVVSEGARCRRDATVQRWGEAVAAPTGILPMDSVLESAQIKPTALKNAAFKDKPIWGSFSPLLTPAWECAGISGWIEMRLRLRRRRENSVMAFPSPDPRFSCLSPGAFSCSGMTHFGMIPCRLLGMLVPCWNNAMWKLLQRSLLAPRMTTGGRSDKLGMLCVSGWI